MELVLHLFSILTTQCLKKKNMQNKNMWLLNMKIKMTVKISSLKFS